MASSMFSGMAAQLTAMNGLLARGLARWMRRASTSLPVPDSPTISTVQSLPATRRARSTIRRDDASTATGSSDSLNDSMLIGNLNSLGRCGQWLQLQLPCPAGSRDMVHTSDGFPTVGEVVSGRDFGDRARRAGARRATWSDGR